MLNAPTSPPESPALVRVKVGAAGRALVLDEIRAIAACENYTEVTLAAMPRLLVRRTMQGWIALLPPLQFARVHRGLLINLDRIARLERVTPEITRLHFIGETIPAADIKRRHCPALRTKLEAWRAAKRAVAKSTVNTEKTGIAVLPFTNAGDDPASVFFCEGVSEELINALAQSPLLRVAARTSAFYFKDRMVPVSEIARQLGVDFIVEGTVRKSASRVRIAARLISAADGFQVWSEQLDRDFTDVWAAQDEIARVIADRLQVKLTSAARTAPAVNPDAHWLVLEGRHFWNLRTPDGLVRAEKAFNAALAIDPKFARAHAGLGDLCVVRAMYRLAEGEPSAADDLDRARNAAQRALALSPTLAEPHTTLGFVCFHEGRPDEAEPHLARAVAINPSYATGYQFYAWTLAALGRLDQALEIYAQAIRLDPLSFINLDRYAAMLFLAGKSSEALAISERAASLRPDVFVGNLSQRAPILLSLGRHDAAVASARAVRQMARSAAFRRHSDADAVFVLRQCGLARESAEYGTALLAELPATNYLRGFVFAALGQFEEALPVLRHVPMIMLPFIYWSPLWAPVREQAGFLELLAQLGRADDYRRARDFAGRTAE